MTSLKEYLAIARVDNWVGWIFSLCIGCVFLTLPSPVLITILLFAFSFATAGIFILNQYYDREDDKENIEKAVLPVASGRITPQRALILSLSLMATSLLLAFSINVATFALFFVYLVLWTAYSAPPFRLKVIPTMDFAVSGIGAGLLPFLIGLSLSSQQNVNVLFVLIIGLSLTLAHSSGHILQALGDHEADEKQAVQTFVVKSGRKKAIILMGIFSIIAGILPFIYATRGFLPTNLFPVLFLPIPFCIPIALKYITLTSKPTTQNALILQKTTRKQGIIVMVLIVSCLLAAKILGV
ncbi:MAG: UbiA family prenyltransferase [Candidatus Bathyarchaeota archaeon]|nr:UbiA family prenyltransferase [Candidatus Bathyarchaeota archaeon]